MIRWRYLYKCRSCGDVFFCNAEAWDAKPEDAWEQALELARERYLEKHFCKRHDAIGVADMAGVMVVKEGGAE